MEYLKKCCGYFTPKRTTMIIGGLGLLISALIWLHKLVDFLFDRGSIKSRDDPKGYISGSLFLYLSIQIIVNGLLLFGVLKDRQNLLIPWIVVIAGGGIAYILYLICYILSRFANIATINSVIAMDMFGLLICMGLPFIYVVMRYKKELQRNKAVHRTIPQVACYTASNLKTYSNKQVLANARPMLRLWTSPVPRPMPSAPIMEV